MKAVYILRCIADMYINHRRDERFSSVGIVARRPPMSTKDVNMPQQHAASLNQEGNRR